LDVFDAYLHRLLVQLVKLLAEFLHLVGRFGGYPVRTEGSHRLQVDAVLQAVQHDLDHEIVGVAAMLLGPALEEVADFSEASPDHQVDVLLPLHSVEISLLERPSHLSHQGKDILAEVSVLRLKEVGQESLSGPVKELGALEQGS